MNKKLSFIIVVTIIAIVTVLWFNTGEILTVELAQKNVENSDQFKGTMYESKYVYLGRVWVKGIKYYKFGRGSSEVTIWYCVHPISGRVYILSSNGKFTPRPIEG